MFGICHCRGVCVRQRWSAEQQTRSCPPSPPQPSGILASKLLHFSVPGILWHHIHSPNVGYLWVGFTRHLLAQGHSRLHPATIFCCPTLELQNALFLGSFAGPWFALVYVFSNGISLTIWEPNFHLDWPSGVSAAVRARVSSCSLLVMPRRNSFSLILCWALSGSLCQLFVRCRSVGKVGWKEPLGDPIPASYSKQDYFQTAGQPSRSEMLPPTGALSQCWASLPVKEVFQMSKLKLPVCGCCPSFFTICHYWV